MTAPDLLFYRTTQGLFVGHGPFEAHPQLPPGQPAFYRQNFSLSEPHPWLVPTHLETTFPLPLGTPPLLDWVEPESERFRRVFEEIMAALEDTPLQKVVPVVVEKAHLLEGDLTTLTQSLAQTSSRLHPYGWWNSRGGVLGATPELLLRWQDQTLETMALAGTAPRSDRHIFAQDVKEIREHELVVEALVERLTELGKIHRHPRTILDLGDVVHFQTRLTLPSLPYDRLAALIPQLHPTPALGCHPRTPAHWQQLLQWRERLEAPAWFGAPFGFWDGQALEIAVAIRGLSWEDHRVQLPSGCGLIRESRLLNEWRELRLKREVARTQLGL